MSTLFPEQKRTGLGPATREGQTVENSFSRLPGYCR